MVLFFVLAGVGTTIAMVAEGLVGRQPLVLVTNSLAVAQSLHSFKPKFQRLWAVFY
jgi:DeoR/GlpR family transcriptional regulator of sugar metabolism